MKKRILFFLLPVFLLSACMPPPMSPPSNGPVVAPPTVIETATQRPPTRTPAPTATVTLTPTPDFSLVGLPVEKEGERIFDFVDQMCNAEWFTRGEKLACPGNETQKDLGFVMGLDGEDQGLPSNMNIMLTYPPQLNFGTISSKYPSLTVQEGDRFRAVITCREHSFCDVQFDLGYFNEEGGHTGLKSWRYIFADSPIVIDYPLDSIAGETVQFGLSVLAKGNRSDAYVVWIAPHIFRPAP
jgi:hypothetical protein